MMHGKLMDAKAILAQGVDTDAHDLVGLMWDDTRNVRFTKHGTKKMPGWAAAFTPAGSTPVRGIGQLKDGGGQKLFFGNPSTLYMWNSATETVEGSGYTGIEDETINQIASTWSFVEWGNWMLATNGVDAPQVWKGTSFAALTGTPPTTAEILLKWKSFVLAFNTNTAGNHYAWCDEDDVENWVVGSASAAGDNIIRDLDSDIIAAVPLGSDIAVYSEDRQVIIKYSGSPFYFGHFPGLKGIGAVSKQSVVPVGRMNYGLSRQGFFRTDGSTFEYLDVDVVREGFLDEINWSQKSKICCRHDETDTEVIWYYPTASSQEPNKGIGFNYRTGVWTFYDHGRTSAEARRIFDYPISAADDGSVYFENNGVDADGAILPAWAQTKAFPFTEYRGPDSPPLSLEDFVKYVDAVKLALVRQSGNGFRLRVGTQMNPQDEIVWGDWFYAGLDMDVVYPKMTGRWFTFRVESDQLGDDWELQGLMAHGVKVGGAQQ